MHQRRKLFKQRNKLVKRLREILIRETDSDDSTVDEILNISLEYFSKDSEIKKEDPNSLREDHKTLPFDIRDSQQTEITLEFSLHTFSKLEEFNDPR